MRRRACSCSQLFTGSLPLSFQRLSLKEPALTTQLPAGQEGAVTGGEPCCPRGPGEGACWRPKETALKKAENGASIVLLLTSLPASGGHPDGRLGPCICYCTSHVVLWGGSTSGPSSPPLRGHTCGTHPRGPFSCCLLSCWPGAAERLGGKGGLARRSFWNTLIP